MPGFITGILAVLAGAGALAGSSAGGGSALFELRGQLDSLDPALAYTQSSWQVEYATCVKLLNYPDEGAPAGEVPMPEAAASLPSISQDGLKYTFVVPPNRFRFSPPSNEQVTAASFARAFERSLSPSISSPALPFANVIVGADDYHAGLSASISGVAVHGPVLTIRLTGPSPDLLARLAMPFFCAVPSDAAAPEVGTVLPSAGPYYVDSADLAGTTVLKANPNYGGNRPHHFDEIDIRANVPAADVEADVIAGRADYAPDGIPLEDWAAVAEAYGPGSPAAQAGHQQFFVNPSLGLRYLVLNASRPLFANADLRRAVNYAIDRPALAADAGAYGLLPTDQILPPGMPGFADADIYPLAGPNLGHAAALAAGSVPATAELYTCLSALCQAIAGHVRDELAPLGLTVNVHSFGRIEELAREQTPGEPFDIAVEGWVADYDDPFDMLNVLIRGGSSMNLGHFDDPFWNGELDAASLLTGTARAQAYADIDVGVMQTAAPMAPIGTINSRDFFSQRIGCQTYSPPFGMSIAALCLR
jgi:peptide/nickel transport system substrate-binding protein